MTNERQAPRDNALADYGTPEWIAEFRGIVDRQADSTEDFFVAHEDVIGLFDALEAMTKERDELAIELSESKKTQYSLLIEGGDLIEELNELKAGHLADLQLLGSQIDQIADITSERDELRVELAESRKRWLAASDYEKALREGLTKERDELRAEIERLVNKLQYFEETVCFDTRKIMQITRPNVGEPQLAIEPQKVTDIIYQNQSLTKDRDAWKGMSSALAIVVRVFQGYCTAEFAPTPMRLAEGVLTEFAEMVKEKT